MTSKAFGLAQLGNAFNDGALSNRNKIINGAMQVAQRGTSTGVTGAGYYGPDRFRFTVGTAGVGTYTISQDTDAPNGFGYSYKLDCTTADAAPDASDAVFVATRFEGQDLQQFKKGTASAESVTLSFWVKSNLTGTYQVNLFDLDNTRIIGATYAISAADTWEQKTITFAGDTTGAFTNDNNLSLQVEWALDGGTDYTSGAVPTAWETTTNADRAAGLTINIADNTANYWQITGVQLEAGDTATPFEHRSYGQELALCQRYYEKSFDTNVAPGASGPGAQLAYCPGNINRVYGTIVCRVTKRAAATYTIYSTSGATGQMRDASAGVDIAATLTTTAGENGVGIVSTAGISAVTNQIQFHYTASAEL